MKLHHIMLILLISVAVILGTIIAFHLTTEISNDGPFPFEMSLVYEDDHFQLECIEGCTWTSVGFSGTTNFVNQDGTGQRSAAIFPGIRREADYLFVVSTENDTIILKGLKGTRWNQLSMSCPSENECRFTFNHLGITSPKP